MLNPSEIDIKGLEKAEILEALWKNVFCKTPAYDTAWEMVSIADFHTHGNRLGVWGVPKKDAIQKNLNKYIQIIENYSYIDYIDACAFKIKFFNNDTLDVSDYNEQHDTLNKYNVLPGELCIEKLKIKKKIKQDNSAINQVNQYMGLSKHLAEYLDQICSSSSNKILHQIQKLEEEFQNEITNNFSSSSINNFKCIAKNTAELMEKMCNVNASSLYKTWIRTKLKQKCLNYKKQNTALAREWPLIGKILGAIAISLMGLLIVGIPLSYHLFFNKSEIDKEVSELADINTKLVSNIGIAR